MRILSNLAATYLSLEKWHEALKHAKQGLQLDTDTIKCMYRTGLAHGKLKQYQEATLMLEKAKEKVDTILVIANAIASPHTHFTSNQVVQMCSHFIHQHG